ncbi:MAG: type II secretion system F family protein [Planctomyces sp.]|nr:type II secretion system F family protein [Planctomyces sp.]
MLELAILGTALWGAAAAMAVYAGEDALQSAFDSVERELREQLRRLRISSRSLRNWLRTWIAAAALAAAATAIGTASVLNGLGVAVLLCVLPWLAIRRMAATRKRKIEEQLADAMVSFSNAVRSGLALPQALEILSQQCPPPIQQEFRQIFGEYRMGKTLEVCLREAKQRLQSQNFALFAAALEASRQSGGRLNETVERIAVSVRELQRLERKLHAETAQARKSALYMACAPPFILAVYYLFFDPLQTTRLFTEPLGVLMLLTAASLNVAAYVLARRILGARL